MNLKLFLPIAAAVSLLTLAACDNRTEPPEQPNPDAGSPESIAEPEPQTSQEPEVEISPEEMEQRRTEIEQDAQEAFDEIMSETERMGDTLTEMGSDAVNSLGDQMDSTSDAIAVQIDELVENAAAARDDNMTEAERLQVVMDVRDSAEEAARALGQSEAEVSQTGDVAEARARDVMGLE